MKILQIRLLADALGSDTSSIQFLFMSAARADDEKSGLKVDIRYKKIEVKSSTPRPEGRGLFRINPEPTQPHPL